MPNFYLSGGDYFLDGNPLPLLLGKNYLLVSANGTDIENAAELQAAYDQANALSPSATNRITIICVPGYYNFETIPFTMDKECIDLVSLDGNRSIVFNSADPEGRISITANDVFVKGVDVQDKRFTIDESLNLLRVENCKGGNQSFGFGVTASGTFTNCEGGAGSFGYAGTASGIFTNCVGGSASFGGFGTASGIFTNCIGGGFSFGSFVTASGTFNYCQGGAVSFGSGGGTASGTFTNCVGNIESFGGFGTADGIFTNCQGGESSFGGGGGTASGTFTNCQGGVYSFGNGGTLSGKLYYCRLTSGLTPGTFETVSGGGRTIYCIDGNNNTNNQ